MGHLAVFQKLYHQLIQDVLLKIARKYDDDLFEDERAKRCFVMKIQLKRTGDLKKKNGKPQIVCPLFFSGPSEKSAIFADVIIFSGESKRAEEADQNQQYHQSSSYEQTLTSVPNSKNSSTEMQKRSHSKISQEKKMEKIIQ